ncbi:phosphoglycerate mutase family protein [Actinomycetospora endophytica]|uniref:Phosphoglycerate mutase family protein n=1 Tax=Actinomycetospora endophytica TaxID=2291215 RepID=A0ABS8PC25_9PSEU|nr:histidine phosphatase family protein [Actinomycetospora endophytica]MCD2195457.1 phosphoglycerate mutase family protein [Actinomycetospora endophytica]
MAGPDGPETRVVLLRHGETHGYFDDVGLTDLGESQAREAGRALGKDLAATTAPGERVRLPHAPTARGTATAVTLRASLVATLDEELGDGHGIVVGDLEPDAHFDSLQFLYDGEARESSVVAARRLALDPDRPAPDWAREYDRFDANYGEASKTGGPIDRWLTTTTRYFEPPQIAVYRLWAGIQVLAAEPERGRVAVVSSHSGPMRAFAAAAIGHDPGEPANLEQVDVRVAGDTATVGFREHRVAVVLPTVIPPWIDPAYLHGNRNAQQNGR